MWVIDLEAAPERLTGVLSRWCVEVRAGFFIGSSTARARDAIWNLVEQSLGADGNAVLVYDTRGPQGFEVRTAGKNRREVVDIDGLWLVRFAPPEKKYEWEVEPWWTEEIEEVDDVSWGE